MTALHLFCRSGSRYSDIKTMVQLQPQLISHPTPNGGDTPLHFAVAAHDLDTIRLLLKTHPAVANIKSTKSGNFGSQMTALHVAILANASVDIIDALVQASPRSLKIRNGNGKTPYHLAVQHLAGDSASVNRVLACLKP
jgi:ankyrin repeat protein